MRTEVIWKRKAWKAETRIRIYFKYKLSGILLISGQLPCDTVFFCCPQEISLLVSFFVAVTCSFQPEFTFPDLYRTDRPLYFLLYLCVSEVSMLMFLLLVRKGKYSKNKKRSFTCLCHRDLFWGERGRGRIVCKCHLCFRGKSNWSYSGLLIIRIGQRQHLE